ECSVTGDIHFTTFDGRRYTFPATCQYILAKSRSSGTFTVTLQNAPCGLNQDGACVQSVSVILHQDPRRQVTLTQAGDVLLFDQYKITPPYSDDAFEIRRLSSVFLRVRTNVGVRVLYDRKGLRLYLQVDQRWVEDTVGLCGTFNGNTQDDFLYVSPSQSRKERETGGPPSYALQSCSVLMGDLFAPCSAYLSPVPYFEQCRRDACRCGQPCLCAALAHYAHLCQRHGLLVDFRAHLSACVCSSQELLSPLSTSPCLQRTDRGPPDLAVFTPTPEPALFRLAFCRNECSCHFQGVDYPPGDSDIPSLGHCVCQRGSFQCTLHPCASTCTVYGDRHYRTFDGLPFDFVGACKVHLIKSTSEFSFSVMVEDVNCYSSGVICRKSITINVGSSLVIFDDDSGDPSPESFLDEKQAVHIWRAGFFTLVHFPREHITLLWDQRTTVHVQAGPQWQGQLAGLCGNFDLKTVNEMRTPENLELTNPQEFGSSWAAVECPDTPDPRDMCVLNPLREPFARKECGILLSEVFETCHPVVDVTWFYSNCLTDTCGCSRGGDCECFCTSVSAYAHQCCQQGVVIDWRTPRLCPYDCGFFNKGKGPYQLSSVAAGGTLVAVKAVDSDIALVRAEDLAPGDISSFLLTAALYKAKAHDPDIVSLEAADRPNFFLHTTANESLGMAKWQGDEAFHQHASFSLHRGTWQAGLVALESLAKPGSFLHASGLKLALRTYEHTEAFRGGALFRLLDAKSLGTAYPICEWHYDACASPCFQTCRDPWAASCQDVPRVEGCVPVCPTPKVLDEVTQRCVYLEDCKRPGVEPALQGPTEARGNETLAPGQVLPTPSDKQQLPQEPLSAPTHGSSLLPVAPLTSAPNPPMAAPEGPVLSPGSTQPTLQPPLGLTASNLPAHHTEALAREEGAASLLATSHLPGSSSSLFSSQQTPTSDIVSGTTETTKVTVTFVGSPNTTVSSRSPPVPRFPLMTKAVTGLSRDSFPVRTTPLQPSWLPSPSSRPVTSLGVPTSLGSHLTTTVTKVTNKTGMSPSVPAQSTSSPTHALAVSTAQRSPVTPLVTKGLEVLPATEKGEPGHSQPIRLPVSSHPSSVPIDLSHLAQHTTTAPRPPALSPGSLAAGTPFTDAHRWGATALVSLESTQPPQLLSGLPLDTSLPLAKVGTSAPVATPGPKGSVTTSPPQRQATTLAVATTVTPPAHTLSLTVPLLSAVEDQAHSPSPMVPQVTPVSPDLTLGATLPSSGASTVTTGVPLTVSVAPRKSTTHKAAILSKKVSPPILISGSAQGGFTELTAVVSHTVTPLVTETEGSQAGTGPLVTTSYFLSRVSARTASRESSLALLPQLAEAHGTPAGLQPQEDLMRQATTEQSGRSAPAHSIADGLMEVEVNISATCVPIAEQDCVRHICLEGQLIRVNQSQHCPQGAARPHCGVLGLAVRVGGDHCCPLWECACRCSIFPDLSFVTFDGSHVALFKEAIYILSQSPDEIISVHVLDCKSANLGHLNWPPFCLVILNVTHLAHHVTIDRFNRKVTVDSQAVWPPVSRYGFRIEDTGHMYVIWTPSHIQIQWLHSSGLMILEASKASKTQGRGLCGICDGDAANDLTLKDGSVVDDTEDPAPFLDSWQVPSSLTSEGQTRFRPDSCATADCSPCLRMVSNRTFSACHHFVSPESFCELWIRDTKYVQQPCVALTVYVAMCHKFHVCIEWRGSDYCPFLCSSDSTYQACVAACEPPETCQDGILGPLDPEQCQVLGEGCVCSEGTILHRRHSALCIPEDKCACTDSTGVPRALGETWNSSLSGCCQQQCQAPDTIIPVDLDCPGPRPESCLRFGEVILLQPTEDPCCLGSVCAYRAQEISVFSVPDCESTEEHIGSDARIPGIPKGCFGLGSALPHYERKSFDGGDPSIPTGCGECPHPIPECQEGEALTVHKNTTELCCPLYQCGTVWHGYFSGGGVESRPLLPLQVLCAESPGFQWEKSQLDEGFMHSAGNVCGCAKYECGEWGKGRYRRAGVMTGQNQEYDHPRDLAACCGSCRNVSCLFTFPNGTTSLFLPGASWIADCARHHCGSTPLGAVLVRSPISCPPLNETECAKVGGSVVPSLEGCCRTCKEDGRSCKKVTIRMTIRKNDCRSNTPVNLVSCDGRCPSASIYNHNINTYARFCKCCREVGLQRRSVQLFCATNATWVPYTVQEPTDCACQWS
ncbi:hypothetical protein STEG23_010757, partial [Scotinomys teguina]